MTTPEFLGRLFFRVAYPLYYRKKLQRIDRITLFGFSLTIAPGVFHPGLFFSTKIFARYLQSIDLQKKSLLEIGSGSGILSLIAASKEALVTCVDINPTAVGCTRSNAEANNLGKAIRVIQSDLFDEIPGEAKFDVIIWNPPFYPKEPTDDASMAWNAGEHYDVLRRFAAGTRRHLGPSGRTLLILTQAGRYAADMLDIFNEYGYETTPVAERRSLFERFTIYEITHRPEQRASQ